MNTHTVGNNIKKFCKRRNMTRSALASAIGVTDSTMSNWVCGHRQPTLYGMYRISRILGVPMERFMEGVEDE